jgi:hypothetical protein
MTTTSADTSVATVASVAGLWEISAVAVGTTAIEALIPDTDHAATTTVEVVSPPEPPVPVDGLYEPGRPSSAPAGCRRTRVPSLLLGTSWPGDESG